MKRLLQILSIITCLCLAFVILMFIRQSFRFLIADFTFIILSFMTVAKATMFLNPEKSLCAEYTKSGRLPAMIRITFPLRVMMAV